MRQVKKKIISLLLVVSMIVTLLPVGEPISVRAATTTYTSGDYTYTLEEDDYGVLVATISGYSGNAVNLTIPEQLDEYKVVAIGKEAFKDNTTLTSVVMKDNVLTIANEAFRNIKKLNLLVLPKKLKTINSAAFAGCTSLKEIEIPASLEETARAFDYTGPFSGSGLESVTFEAGTTKIAQRLFKGCKNLKAINIPDSVTVIGEEAFQDATGLTDVKFSANLESIKKSAFYGCTSLQEISIPDSVTEIANEAYRNCTKLEKVKLSSRVQNINSAAFAGCTSLKEIEIPASLEETARAFDYTGPFSGSGLESVTFEAGTTKIAQRLFKGCKNLKAINIPDSVTEIEAEAFQDATSLNNVTFSDSMTSIGKSAFYGCTALEKVSLPVALKKIGESTFYGCSDLSEVYLQKKITSIGKNAFGNDENVEVYAPKYSDTTVLLIDNSINMAFSNSYHVEEENDVVDWTVTSYEMSDASASGYIPLVLKYAVKEKYQEQVSDLKLLIGASPISCINSVKVDGTQIAVTTDRKDHVIVPLEKMEGTITIYVAPNDYGKIASYVKLEYKKGGAAGSSLLGAVSERSSALTLGVNDKISYENGASSITIPVRGYAVKQKEVDVYLDNSYRETVTASLNGIYETEITLNNPEDYKDYTIKVVSENRLGNEVSVEKKIYTVLEAPVLTEATLYIEAHDYKGGSATFNMLDGENKIKYITFQPGKKYEFRLKYSHADKLDRVFVVSTRGSVRTLLEAVWDQNAGAYITHGYFDDDSSYVPGNLSVEIIMKEEKSTVSENGEITLSNKDMAEIPDKWKNASVKENKDTSSDYEAEINLGNGDKVIYSYDQMSFTEFADSLKSEYIEGNGSSTVSGSFLGAPGKSSGDSSKPPMTQSDISDLIDILEATGDDGKEYADIYNKLKSFGFVEYITGEADLGKDLNALIRFDYSAEDIVAYIIDPSQCDNNILKYVVKRPKDQFKKSVIELIGDKTAGNFLYSMGGNIVEFEGNAINLLWARTEILSDPSLTEAQRQAKLAQLDQMRDIMCEQLVMQYLSSALRVAGVMSAGTGIGYAAIILSKVIDNCIIPMIKSGDFDRFIQGDISLKTLIIRWILDPSGYVYEGVTSNRLSDVKATLYYKAKESSTQEILWDAKEYDQENPLYTDQNGCYAWDVPEGYWRVKYEKNGYETTYSEWMPVPPPQTDVNIAMVPTSTAKVTDIHVYENHAIIGFDQYMDPASILNIQLVDADGKAVEYTVSYDRREKDEDGNVYAKTFELAFSNTKIAEVQLINVNRKM